MNNEEFNLPHRHQFLESGSNCIECGENIITITTQNTMNNEELTLHAGDDYEEQEERDESDYYPNTREDETI